RIVSGLDRAAAYRAELTRLSDELVDAKCGLAEAVERLAATERYADPKWQAFLADLFPLPTPLQALAAHLVHQTLTGLGKAAHDRVAAVRRRVEAEFEDAFASPAVESTDGLFHEPRRLEARPCQIPDAGERNPAAAPTIKNEPPLRHPGRRRMPLAP